MLTQCFVCERAAEPAAQMEYNADICAPCLTEHDLHSERAQVQRELRDARDQIWRPLTMRQLREYQREPMRCPSRRPKLLAVHARILELQAIACAYSVALGDL